METIKNTKFYYIHGLHSSKESSKFKELKKQYNNIECLEWRINDNLDSRIFQWLKLIENNGFENNCIIASSTGCNFAYQLKNLCKSEFNMFIHLVLINPLFDIQVIYDKTIIPKNLKYFLEKVNDIKDSLIFVSENDEVIDNQFYINKKLSIKNNNNVIFDKNEKHKFENIKKYFQIINDYINNIYI